MQEERVQGGRSWFWPLVAVLLFTVAYAFLYLQVGTRWWFEDDPATYHHVSTVDNPIRIFTDPGVMRGAGAGVAVVPMLLLSYWIDIRLFGFEATPAYLHSLLVLLATIAALFFNLRRGVNDWVAASGSVLWLLIPSTIATYLFLSTRHYVEGLFYFLVLMYLARRNMDAAKWSWRLWAGVVVLCAAAMLSKEIYATLVPTFLFVCAARRKDLRLAGLGGVLIIGFAAYRIFLVGGGMTYGGERPGPRVLAKFLAVLPQTLSASVLGYLAFGVLLFLTFLYLRQEGREGRRTAFEMVLLLGAVLVALFPVAGSLASTFATPGPWYRVPFIVNTLLLIWGFFMVSRVRATKAWAAGFAVSFLVIATGAEITRSYWDTRMKKAEREGRFYLGNPDKLVLSDENAYWYLTGLHRMYASGEEHWVSYLEPTSPVARERASRFSTIWRSDGERFVQDPVLFRRVRGK